jgi:hypothetical protein
MPTTPAKCAPATRACRWEEIQGGRVKGRVTSTKIWICEYPYRTMRRNGPSEDCTDCPVYHALQQEKERARQEEIEAQTV